MNRFPPVAFTLVFASLSLRCGTEDGASANEGSALMGATTGTAGDSADQPVTGEQAGDNGSTTAASPTEGTTSDTMSMSESVVPIASAQGGGGASSASMGNGGSGGLGTVGSAGDQDSGDQGSGGAGLVSTGGNTAQGGNGAGTAGTNALGVAGQGGGGASSQGGGGGGGTSAVEGTDTGGAGSGGATPAELSDTTVWLAGDSTVAQGSAPCAGWGQDFESLFNDYVTVVNSAAGGRSVRTWLYNVLMTMDASGECELQTDGSGEPTLQGRWQAMLDGMEPGDYLLIQFGINDGDRNCDRHVGLEAFKESYAMMAQAAKERGAHPVFITPVSMIKCEGSTAVGSRGAFVPATLEVGEDADVPVIDLHEMSVALYNELGFCPIPGGGDVSAGTTGDVGNFFCNDHTHFEASGAAAIGELVVQGLQEQGIGLAAYLKQ